MPEIFVKIRFFDPVTDEEFEISGGIETEIVEIPSYNHMIVREPLRMNPAENSEIFSVDTGNYEFSDNHFFRVGFVNPNFSKKTGKLYPPEEVTADLLPVYIPAKIPYWDTGWDDNYESNEYFSDDGPKFNSTKDNPLTIKIPVRRFFCIGHRGAPYHFPENTLASFEKSIELGADGFEFDICKTKDKKLVVFHDPKPVKYPDQFDRTFFEDLPYEFVSPVFTNDGKSARIMKLANGKYKQDEEIKISRRDQFDIKNLTCEEVRRYYKFKHVNGTEHKIMMLSEFLGFVSHNCGKVKFLFFDCKNADCSDDGFQTENEEFGDLLAAEIKKIDILPEFMVICNTEKKRLEIIKESFEKAGEKRCLFAFDAGGSFSALFGAAGNPLKIAREMGNNVVSIGSLMRPGNIEEIKEAVRDRDYNQESSINMVIHWTINDTAKMVESIMAGSNGVLTDKPDELTRMLKRLRVKIV